MIKFVTQLPGRQKFLLLLTAAMGTCLVFFSVTGLLPAKTLNKIITFYGLGIPSWLLVSNCLADLDDFKTYLTWFFISIVLLMVCILTKGNEKFLTGFWLEFDRTKLIDTHTTAYSTRVLKTLFCFLIVYRILNWFAKDATGNSIISTMDKVTGYSREAKRNFTAADVISNILLFLTIIFLATFG